LIGGIKKEEKSRISDLIFQISEKDGFEISE